MYPGYLAILLASVGIVLLLAEVLLPTHGVLGFLGIVGLFGAIGVCFWIDQWLGLGVLLAAMIASPFVATWMINLWPRTPVGKRLILRPLAPSQEPTPLVTLGQTGVAISELRPMGECDFGDRRLEAISEYGMIAAGQQVKGGRSCQWPADRPPPLPVSEGESQGLTVMNESEATNI